MKKIFYFAGLFFALTLVSCDEQSTEQEVKPDGQKDIQYVITNTQTDSTTILTTTYKVMLNGQVVKEFTKSDTLPSAGMKEIEEEVYNEELDEYSYPTKKVPDSYNLYITTK
jgi:hypothetical protein